MSTAQELSDRYHREVEEIGAVIDDLIQDRSLPLAQLVWRARSLYHAAWQREMLRYRETKAQP